MALDPALVAALQQAVTELGQSNSVALRLNAWLKSLSDGESSEDQSLQFYENVLEELKLKDADHAH